MCYKQTRISNIHKYFNKKKTYKRLEQNKKKLRKKISVNFLFIFRVRVFINYINTNKAVNSKIVVYFIEIYKYHL